MSRQHQAQKAIKDQHAFLQQVIDIIPGSIFVRGREGQYLLVNNAGAEAMGVTVDDTLGKSEYDFNVTDEQAQKFIDEDHLVIDTMQELSVVEPVVYPGEVVRWVQTTKRPIIDPDGKSNSVLLFLNDVSDQKLAQDVVLESEYRLKEAQRLASIGNWSLDGRSNRMQLSEEALCIFGLSEAPEFTHDDYLTLIPPEDRNMVASAYYQSIMDRTQYALTHRIVMSDGSVKYIHERCETTYDEDGNPVLSIGTMQDVTERKLAELELQSYREHLEDLVQQRTEELENERKAAEAANKAKSVFLANMSHELRTPLNAVLGYAQIMMHANGISPDQSYHLGAIQSSGEHLLDLINDILSLSRIEAGRVGVNSESFDLHVLVQGLNEMFMLKASQKSLDLHFDLDSSLPRYIRSDEVKLRQVLINLLGNAVKFTEEGTISLRAWSECAAQSGMCRLFFEVSDTGPGIPESSHEEIFDVFEQVNQGVPEGTGLGLAISRKYARMMGGDVEVVNGKENGAAFLFAISVELSCIEDQPTMMSQVIAIKNRPVKNRLLIVDDHVDSRKLLSVLLKGLKIDDDSVFEVRQASNGQEAVEMWQEWQPHLIWMDIRMPVMDGKAATCKIRELCQDDNNPVIVAVTASVFDEERDTLIALGCNDVIHKPYRDDDIYLALARDLDVEFIYSNEQHSEAIVDPAQPESVTPEQLAEMLLQVRDENFYMALERATITLDADELCDLGRQVGGNEPQLGSALLSLAAVYDYSTVSAAMDLMITVLGENNA